jgi:serine/threonine-protein kinase
VARGVPSAFAAIVRKLMNKAPEDRYQSCAELAVDLAKWTDPGVVRSIIGSAAESARAFRPPPPVLEDSDLRFLNGEATIGDSPTGSTTRTLRDLGDAEPPAAPMHKKPPAARPAVVVPKERFEPTAPPVRVRDEREKLIHFVAIAFSIGLLGIILLVVVTKIF